MKFANVVRLAAIGVLTLGIVAAIQSCQPKTQEPARPHTTSPSADSAVAAATTLDRGRMAYLGYCGMCHGAYGAGDGPMSGDLVKQGARGPAVLNNKARLTQLGREGLIDVISKGGGHTGRSNLMPPWGETLDRQMIGEIADYVLSLPDFKPGPTAEVIQQYLAAPAGVPAQGRELFVFHCTACHGPYGKGDGTFADTLWVRHQIRPRNLTDTAYLSQKTDQELFAAISLGGGHMGKSMFMPAWNYTFQPAQIKDLIAYVRSISNTKSKP
jgi:cbb3-type cytochrome c oxidase subunit III